MKNRSRLQFRVIPQFYILIAFAVLIIPLRWLLSWMISTAVHEVFHYVALRRLDCPVTELRVGIGGVSMQTGELTWKEEFICASAGPIGSLVLVLIAKWFPTIGLCAFVQLMYNLLPVLPLDGGRILFGALKRILGSQKGSSVFQLTEKAVVALILIALVILLMRGVIGVLFAAFVFFLLRNVRCGKYACKAGEVRVQ